MTEQTQMPIALQAWLSPSYPVGGFAYSHGLEWAAETGQVIDRRSLLAWLRDNLEHGSGWNDAVLFSEIWRRQDEPDTALRTQAVVELAEFGAALNATAELRQESLQQGAAFLAVTRRAWPHDDLETFALAAGRETPYPVCFALAAQVHGCRLRVALQGYLFALASNWISAAVRLNIVGQTAAQEIAAEIASLVTHLAEQAALTTLDDIGGCSFLNEIASFRHEEQYSRLFRS